MALNRITLAHFRNHAASHLDGTARLNLLVGENGAGKTNVLEALSLFAPGRGLRRAVLADMAGHDAQAGFAVSALLEAGEPLQLGTGTAPDRPGRRIVQINGAEAAAVSLGEWLAVSWLTPAMDRLFADGASARRRYVDRLALAVDPAHARYASRYEVALRERGRLLTGEQEPDPAWLTSIEAQMAEHGSKLAQSRARLVAMLGEALATLPDQPFARPALNYCPGGPRERESLADELSRNRARDRAAQRSLIGPHRDELQVTMVGKNVAAASCSTGEQKAMLIAITLAHAGLAAHGRPGLLLLDEVAAHLDPIRRSALFDQLRVGGSQVWLTGTETAPFDEIIGEAAVWRVSGGQVERV